MGDYTVQKEAGRIFHEVLLKDSRLGLPAEVLEAAPRTVIDDHSTVAKPFLPAPTKPSETSTALWALLATYGNAIAKQRFGIDQSVTINSDVATVFIFAFVLSTLGGKGITDPGVAARLQRYDTKQQNVPWRRFCTNVYPTRDGRWFHLHGGMDASKSLQMLGLPTHDATATDEMEIIQRYCERVREFDAEWLDLEANEHWRQSGCIALTQAEYLASDHGKAVANDPIYIVEEFLSEKLPPVPWPVVTSQTFRPLEGIKFLDLTRVIAGPTIARIAALFGATVIRVSHDELPELGAVLLESNLGKRDVEINLKSDEGRKTLLRLLEDADVILDGYRPGALDRLGFGPAYVHELARRRGKGIVYARENCYGWNGPLSHRSGWQMISDHITGLSWEMGKFVGLDEPIVPPLPNADFQAALIGCIGITNALDRRARKGGNYLVSTSLNQYSSFLLSVGLQGQEVQEALREKWSDMEFRHYDTQNRMLQKLVPALHERVPGLFSPDYFASLPAKWGVPGEELTFLRPAATYDTTKLGYDVGSCEKGSYEAEWP
ncbi:CAIB/BAIF family enzyme [Xylariales sp. PMI_506]|nr:CAIB/BAIF family enzyme [Xylariales sp. PMI_506]